MEIARAEGIIVQEAFHGPEALAAADEVFVTSTLREVMPITQLVSGAEAAPETRPVANGKPGPVTKRLHAAFRKHVDRWLQEALPRWEQGR
jgi:branched-subunit amino acid aminotransferase/4-amino-4-deoxychorismate lyase